MSLHDLLIQRIQTQGPLSVADFMADCLLHPQYGYYATRDPLGQQGDFTTAPEISQMFGELLGLCLAQAWIDQGQPSPFALVELGPGRGTLMADVVRATQGIAGFADAAEIHLVEASPTLRTLQASALQGCNPMWHSTVDDLPDLPTFAIANEFFDALPVRQFLRDGAGWRERQVGLLDGALSFGLGPTAPQAALTHRLDDTQDGDLVELSDAAAPILSELANRIATRGGIALIIDYGDWRSLGDTLQAMQSHAPADPLENPGHADLTTQVDFEVLAHAARTGGVQHTKLTPQGVFLERLGITDRARALAGSLDGPALESLIAAHRRLTHPEEMGNLFKVLGLFPANAMPPPGLET